MTTIHIDFETRSTADLRKTGAHAYAEDPSTEALCMAWAIDDGPVEILTRENANGEVHVLGGATGMYDILNLVKDGATVVAHNAQFELQIWNKIMAPRYGWPMLDPAQCRCTMAMAYALALPGSLENAAAALGIEVRKDMKGRNLMLRLSKPKAVNPDGSIEWHGTPEQFEQLYAYCRQDVEVERSLESRLLPLVDDEQSLWALDQQINERGIQVDLVAIERAMAVIDETKKRLNAEMRRITGGWVKSCTAVGDLTEWLGLKGVEVDGVAKADITALLGRGDLPAEVRKALELRRDAAKSSTAKLKTMRAGVSADGRCRGTLQYHGAGTGRWAGRRVQFQNVPRPNIKQSEIEEVMDLLGASDA